MKDTSFHGENLRRRARYIAVFSGLVIAFAVTVVLNINTGNVHISVPKILRILFLRDGAATEYSIIWRIRLPRILMAAMLGGALSLSGFLLQTFFANPIAGPFVLGISSGAKMVVALTMIIFLKYIGHFSSYTLIVAAFIGSLISTGFILLMSKKVHHMAALLVRHCQSAWLVAGKFFRNELEQCAGGGSGSRDRICMHVPVVETGQCLPAW